MYKAYNNLKSGRQIFSMTNGAIKNKMIPFMFYICVLMFMFLKVFLEVGLNSYVMSSFSDTVANHFLV